MSGIKPEQLEAKLNAVFAPTRLEVIDESEQHRGHGGWREGGGTHYRVVMRAPAFAGMSRVQRSRAVHSALSDELAGGVHALALDLAPPD
ncbi:BolA family protein [Amaricoccus solimangrovi]|uniref:BolA family transcriptional regulator n=1 Tax=Amaricoccus solimangrovi TaxID=2589815 RepID=A0A501WMU8_9RHOB|nr:BolA family protein [Amaricoccus solimangrovi]TPE50182.1 BolA family transcriptional regulator [Amaricoccus solimangrovi]